MTDELEEDQYYDLEPEKDQEAQENYDKRELQKAVEYVMSDKRGRDFINWLLGITAIYGQSYISERPQDTAFHEGRRNVGQHLVAFLNENTPQNYVKMIQEDLDGGQ